MKNSLILILVLMICTQLTGAAIGGGVGGQGLNMDEAPDLEGIIYPNDLKVDSLYILNELDSGKEKTKKAINKAKEYIEKSLGNLSDNGDKNIRWISGREIECDYGEELFDYEGMAVIELKKIVTPIFIRHYDSDIKDEVNKVIGSLVNADLILAEETIKAMANNNKRSVAERLFNLGELYEENGMAATAIRLYRSAWKLSCDGREDKSKDNYITGKVTAAVGGEKALKSIIVLIIAATGILIFARLKK